MRAAVYTRISNDPTGREAGVQRQETDCRTLVESDGLDLVGVWTDNDRSATDKRKPREQYQDLVNAIRGDAVDCVVVWHVDRLYRRLGDLQELLDMIDDGHLPGGVRTVTAGDIDLNTGSGQTIAGILASVAHGEVKRTQERLAAMNRHAAKKGERVGGRRAFGYETDGATIRDTEAAVYADMVDRVLDGASLRSIATRLNGAGITTAGGSAWSTARVRDTLRNPRYVGLRTYRGEIVGDATWSPLVDRETWEILQAILSDPRRRTSPGPARKHLLSGFAFCGACGARLTTGKNHGRPAYRCRSVKDGGCGSVVMDAATADEIVRRRLFDFVADPKVAEAVATAEATPSDVVSGIPELEQRLDGAAGAYAAGEISRRQLATASERMNAELDRLRAQLTRRTAPTIDPATVTKETWGDSFEFRRDLVAAAVEKVTILKASRPGIHADTEDRVDIHWRD